MEEYIRGKIKVNNDEIIKYILSYMNSLDYFTDYISKTDLITRLSNNLRCIKFFEDDDPITKKYKDLVKGLCITENNKCDLYIRKNVPNRELIFDHELTHLLQKKKCNNGLIFNNHGYLMNEVIVQYIAETILNLRLIKKYDSKDLRMLPGIEIESDLKAYQHFDYLVTLILKKRGYTKEKLANLSFINCLYDIDFIYNNDYELIDNLDYIFKTDKFYYMSDTKTREELLNGKTFIYDHLLIDLKIQKKVYKEVIRRIK